MSASGMRQRQRISQRSSGFTLIEILIVIVIVTIVTAAIVAFSADSYRKTQLRDGATQLVADLNRARSQAQRSSFQSSVTLSGTVGSPSSSYQTSWTVSGTTATNATKSLSGPVRVAPINATYPSNSVVYSAPYGEVGGTNAVSGILWEISSLSTSAKLYIKAVGVTGKVILSAIPD